MTDFNKLKTLSIVAEVNSITKAAHTLGRTQSAITQQLKSLESELGLKLFEREGQGVRLSPAGEKLSKSSREFLGELENSVIQCQDSQLATAGHIHIGSLNDYGTELNLESKVGQFLKAYSNITVEIHTYDSSSMEAALLQNKIDFGFKVLFSRANAFHRHSIVKSSHSLYCSKTFAANNGPIKTIKQLLEKPLIDLDENYLAFKLFVKKYGKNQMPALRRSRPRAICPNFAMAREIVLSGAGVALLPDYLAAKSTKLVKLLDGKSLSGTTDIAYCTNRSLRMCEKLFLDYIIKGSSLQ